MKIKFLQSFITFFKLIFIVPGFILTYEYHDYFISYEKFDWFKANSTCHDNNMSLLTIHNQDDQNLIKNLMILTNLSQIWTSGNDLNELGVFKWQDDKKIDGNSFTYWMDSYPHIGTNHTCININVYNFCNWENINCFTNFSFICKNNCMKKICSENSQNSGNNVKIFFSSFILIMMNVIYVTLL